MLVGAMGCELVALLRERSQMAESPTSRSLDVVPAVVGQRICSDLLLCSRCVLLCHDATQRPTAWARSDASICVKIFEGGSASRVSLGISPSSHATLGALRETQRRGVPEVVRPFRCLTTTDDASYLCKIFLRVQAGGKVFAQDRLGLDGHPVSSTL